MVVYNKDTYIWNVMAKREKSLWNFLDLGVRADFSARAAAAAAAFGLLSPYKHVDLKKVVSSHYRTVHAHTHTDTFSVVLPP